MSTSTRTHSSIPSNTHTPVADADIVQLRARSSKKTSHTAMVQLRAQSGVTGSSILQALRDPKIRACALQKKSSRAQSTASVHAQAADGVKGTGGSLPHLETIQASFGRHNVRNVEAFSGDRARAANAGMGAQAYAYGERVAFGKDPDVHTAAHEAAHVVQQRAGVSVEGGVGQVGDAYERHADAVADAVVSGQSAEPILDRMQGAQSDLNHTRSTVHRKEDEGADTAEKNTKVSPEEIAGLRAFLDGQVLDVLDRALPKESRGRAPGKVNSLARKIEEECIRISSALDLLEEGKETEFGSPKAIGAAALAQKKALEGVRDALCAWGVQRTASVRAKVARMQGRLQEQSALVFHTFREYPKAFERAMKGSSYKDTLKNANYAIKGLGEMTNLFAEFEGALSASKLDQVSETAVSASSALLKRYGKVKGVLDLLGGLSSTGGLKSNGQDLITTAQNAVTLLVFLDDWTGNKIPNVAIIAELTKSIAQSFEKVHALTQKGNAETHALFGVIFKPGAEIGGRALYNFMGALMRGEETGPIPGWIRANHDVLQELAESTGISGDVPQQPERLKSWLEKHKRIVCLGIYGARLSPEGFLMK